MVYLGIVKAGIGDFFIGVRRILITGISARRQTTIQPERIPDDGAAAAPVPQMRTPVAGAVLQER